VGRAAPSRWQKCLPFPGSAMICFHTCAPLNACIVDNTDGADRRPSQRVIIANRAPEKQPPLVPRAVPVEGAPRAPPIALHAAWLAPGRAARRVPRPRAARPGRAAGPATSGAGLSA